MHESLARDGHSRNVQFAEAMNGDLTNKALQARQWWDNYSK